MNSRTGKSKRARSSVGWSVRLLTAVLFISGSAWAQFTANIQGTVRDSSGATVPQAKVTLVNTVTSVSATSMTDPSGLYQFVSIAPGTYTISVQASGFSTEQRTVTVETYQTLSVEPFVLKPGPTSQSIVVNAQTPILNPAETRNEQTLTTEELSEVPLAGRNMLSLTTMAAGMSGLGVSGGPGVTAGPPGTGVDNFNTEEAVDASAKGQGSVANVWIVDGLNISSVIYQGVLNLTPNPDDILEASNQVNTFTADYGNASGTQFVMTTKSGTDRFHFLASDYFSDQYMFARYSLPGDTGTYSPFHSNNFSGTVGGPIIPHRRFFFFFSVEPLRSSASTGNTVQTYPAPQTGGFIPWAQENYPGTIGTNILTGFPVSSRVLFSSVNQTAAAVFPGTCGTVATDFLPCSIAMTDIGIFNATNFRNGTQYFARVDKYFDKDRFYFSYFRTLLAYGGPAVIPQFGTTNNNNERAYQGGWTHTFGPTMLNEVFIGKNRVQGLDNETGNFEVPPISVIGENVGYGIGFAQGNFYQNDYHWRDTLTKVRGAHIFKVGYDGSWGDDPSLFAPPNEQPYFSFNTLLALAQDAPENETGVYYNPQTGQEAPWTWEARSSTWGAFAEDTWKARRNLTLTIGFRFDNQGNPSAARSWPATIFGNFHLGTGSTFAGQVANGSATTSHYALSSTPRAYNPRLGLAWDITGTGSWVLHGGFGMYSNALTMADEEEMFQGGAPGYVQPTFVAGSSTPPVFALGTSNTPPFGFVYPALAGSSLCPTVPCLDAHGGIVGSGITIGAEDPYLKSATSYQWAGTLEHKMGNHLVASVFYSGAHDSNLVSGGDIAAQSEYGTDINALPGGLIGLPYGALAPTLNSSFGVINYSENTAYSNYEGVTFNLRGRLEHGFFDVSYTRSSSKDNAGRYPTSVDISQYYGPSPWDVPNRFSLSFNYQLAGLYKGEGAIGKLTSGWGISGTSFYQTGYPFAVFAGNLFDQSTYVAGGEAYLEDTGDYSADGVLNDFPNVTNYHQSKNYFCAPSSSSTCVGVLSESQFTVPTMGTEGNEKSNQFREPPLAETDASVYKDIHLTERLTFQFRFDIFNLFNRANYWNIQNNVNAANFGQVQSQYLPRYWDLGGKFTF
jgi:hypothetical protein